MNKSRFLLLVISLAAMAGLVNAVTLFGFDGATVSHVSGLFSKFAAAIAVGQWQGGFALFGLVFSFFAGAVVAGAVTGERAFHMEKIYGFIILAIGVLMILPVFLDMTAGIYLLTFLMGLQNGMVVWFRGILVRSTHMTGNLTDLGVFVGYKLRGNKSEKKITALVPGLSLLGFCLGGIAGILFYRLIGKWVFAVASGFYLALFAVYFYFEKTCIDRDFNGIPDDRE